MDIFISHSSYDGVAVRSLVEDLEGGGKQVWLDLDLQGGETWWAEILARIRACTVFVFAVSEHSLKSEPCRAELTYASALGLPVLPVQIGEVKSYRIDSIFEKQSIDYRNPTSTTGSALIGALEKRAKERKDLPDPLPEPPPIPYEYLQQLGETIAGPQAILYPEQSAMVGQLTQAYREQHEQPGVRADIRSLLESLKNRPDTARTVVEEITSFLKATPTDRAPLLRRSWERHRRLVIATIILITTAAIGVTGYILGLGQHHNNAPRIIRVALTEDRFGLVIGADSAPAKVDIFMEPQCPDCGQFDAVNSGDILRQVEDGKLEVTYRPLTFEDTKNNNDYSKRSANAMFLAASPNSGTSPKQISSFIAMIFAPHDRLPDNAELAWLASNSGISSQVAERIGAGDVGVDTAAMDDANGKSLLAKLGSVSVPTVYDTVHHAVLDSANRDWLNLLMARCVA
jgi:TIR domain/Thioredoxin